MKTKQLFFFLTIVIMCLMASPGKATAQTYDVNYHEQTIEQIIKDLRKRTGYQFVYKKEITAGIGTITCRYEHATLNQLLNRIFYEEAGLDYEISKGTIILKKASSARPYFKRTVVGLVTDERDEPLTGVTVRALGTNNGVTTDLDGHFSILAEGKAPVLEFSYVGMRSKSVPLSTRSPRFIVIKLEPEENMLHEILVTGYQNIKRENATGAYQIISAADLDERHTRDLVSRLEGQIPGLTIYNNGKNDGGESALTIRGVGSFQARTSPLIVVDGLPIEGSIETVNPYDIASITVLKDASAASIYGARASNGVIVITTKRAQSEKLSIDFNADLTIAEKQSYDNRRWASAAELLKLEAYNFDYVASKPDIYNSLVGNYRTNPFSLTPSTRLMLQHRLGEVSDADYQATMDRWRSNDYRQEWRDAMLRNQIQQQYNIALRTKGKTLNSNLVLNYAGDNMGRTREHTNTYQLSYLGDLAAAKWLDLSFGINLINERAKTHYADSYNDINAFAPYRSMFNEDGTPAAMEASVYLAEPSLQDPSLGLKPVTYNLLEEINRNFSNSRRNNIRTFIHANIKLLPELSLATKFQYEDIIYKSETYLENESYFMRLLYNLATSDGTHYIPDGGMLRSNHQNGDYYTFRAQANYSKIFAEKHALEAIAGFEFRQTHNRYTRNLLLGYDDLTQTNMNHLVNFYDLQYLQSSDLGVNYSPIGSMPTEDDYATSDMLHRYYSLYANANYTYDSKYSASFSYRVDKTDLFGADPKFRGRPLWSVGASWNIDREDFMKPLTWIDGLKLRASYGLTGNIDQNVSSYLTATIAVNEVNGKKGATLNTPPNDQLRWEKTASWNVGIDFSFLRNRLSGSVDWYYKRSSDLLSLTDVDPTTGWSSLTINNGKARNTGVEMQLDAKILEGRTTDDLAINASFNIAYNNNKVLSIDHMPSSGFESLSFLHAGRPVNALHSYRFAGMQTSEDGVQAYGWYDKDGNIHITDIASGEFNLSDVIYSGSLDPKLTASLTPEITWRNFSLSAMFAYYGGHVMRAAMEDWSHGGYYTGYTGMDEPVPSAYLNYWTAADKTTAIANGYPGSSTVGSPAYIDQTVHPADFLKLRNVVLGYHIPKRLCNALGIQGLRVRLQMNNVAKWVRNGLGIDPEAVDPLSGYALDKPRRSYTMSVSVNL